jgi:hypothetical protein
MHLMDNDEHQLVPECANSRNVCCGIRKHLRVKGKEWNLLTLQDITNNGCDT